MERDLHRRQERDKRKAGYKKPAIPYFVRRILLSWLIFLIIGGLIGGAIGHAATKKVQAGEGQPPAAEYGTRDGRSFAGEVSMDWGGGCEFTPIDCALPEELQEFTFYLSKGYYIDFSFAMGLMYCESSFRTEVVSGTNDFGLMQINTCNHEWLAENLGLTDMTNPYQNIRAGLYILRRLFEKYDDPAKVCMAYNMGEYGASILWEQGVYETSYSRKVLAKADEFKVQLENGIKK